LVTRDKLWELKLGIETELWELKLRVKLLNGQKSEGMEEEERKLLEVSVTSTLIKILGNANKSKTW
jgi:hypothetical protein